MQILIGNAAVVIDPLKVAYTVMNHETLQEIKLIPSPGAAITSSCLSNIKIERRSFKLNDFTQRLSD